MVIRDGTTAAGHCKTISANSADKLDRITCGLYHFDTPRLHNGESAMEYFHGLAVLLSLHTVDRKDLCYCNIRQTNIYSQQEQAATKDTRPQ